MSGSGHDPQQARRATRELAATSDAQLVADIRRVAGEVAARADRWRRTATWQQRTDQHAYDAARAMQARLTQLGAQASLAAVQAAVRPVLALWWPPTSDTAEAVEQLRAAALHRPALVRDARSLTAAASLAEDQHSLLREVLDKHAPRESEDLASRAAAGSLTRQDRSRIAEVIAREFTTTGLGAGDEPVERGKRLEALLDLINRPNLQPPAPETG